MKYIPSKIVPIFVILCALLGSRAGAQTVETAVISPADGEVIDSHWVNVWSVSETDDPLGLSEVGVYIDGELFDFHVFQSNPAGQSAFLTSRWKTHVPGPHTIQSYAISKSGVVAWSAVVTVYR